MYSDTGNTTSLVLGFPIRTSSDQRSVGSSPRHIAASHVLHRPLMPRHPPCALKHLQHKNQSSKIEITPQRPTTIPTTPKDDPHCRESMLATTIHESNTTPHHQNLGATTRLQLRRTRTTGLLSHSPTVCLAAPTPPPGTPDGHPGRHEFSFAMCTRPAPTTGERAIQRIA